MPLCEIQYLSKGGGGDPILYQHYFDFLDTLSEVNILIFPESEIISHIIIPETGKPETFEALGIIHV